jgi:hypothetical protein
MGPGDIVKSNFEQTISNLPGKSLIAVEVEYPPGAGSLPHVHVYVQARVGPNRPARAIP